jgi:hypothetical protein
LDAFREAGLFRILRNRPHRAGLLAFQTLVAVLIDSTLENPNRGDQAEQSSQRTKIAAPETLDDTIENDDPSEDEERDSGHIIDRLKIVLVRCGNPFESFKQRTQ